MKTIKIGHQTVNLSAPTTHQTLLLLDLHRRVKGHAAITDPAALAIALSFDDAMALVELLASVTRTDAQFWLSKPLHETLQSAIDVATAWLPILNEYLTGTVTPMLTAIAGQVATD